MGAFAVDGRLRRHAVEVHGGDGIDGVDEAHRIGTTRLGRCGRFADVGDVGRELHDHRLGVILLAPARDHFDVFRHLTHGGTHAAFAHPVGAAEVQLNPVGAGVFDQWQNGFPGMFFAGHHDGDDHGAVWIVGFDALDLFEVGEKVAVGDQLNVVEPQQTAVSPIDGPIAGAVHVDDRRTFGAQGFPDHTTPSSLKGAADVVFLVRGRRRGQPERIGGADPQEVTCQIGHLDLLVPVYAPRLIGRFSRRLIPPHRCRGGNHPIKA